MFRRRGGSVWIWEGRGDLVAGVASSTLVRGSVGVITWVKRCLIMGVKGKAIGHDSEVRRGTKDQRIRGGAGDRMGDNGSGNRSTVGQP